ncbi:hypothetical protein RI367_005912 [Sorochytrium milnesiophthora]
MSSPPMPLEPTPHSTEDAIQTHQLQQQQPQYLYWVQPAQQDEDDQDDSSGVWLLEQDRASPWANIVAYWQSNKRNLLLSAFALWLQIHPPMRIYLDSQREFNLNTVRHIQLDFAGLSQSRIRYLINPALPPHTARMTGRVSVSNPVTVDGWSGDFDMPVNGTFHGYFIAGVSIGSDPSAPQFRVVLDGKVELSADVLASHGTRHKRDIHHGLSFTVNTQNTDHVWDIPATSYIRDVRIHNVNGKVSGRVGAQRVKVHNVNGDVDLAVTLAASKLDDPDPDSDSGEETAVDLRTGSGDLTLRLDVLGGANDGDDNRRRLQRRQQNAAYVPMVVMRSDKGNVCATYTLPADLRPHFMVNYSMSTAGGVLAVVPDLHTLPPDTHVRDTTAHNVWQMPRGSISCGDSSPTVFGSSLAANLSSQQGNVVLRVA